MNGGSVVALPFSSENWVSPLSVPQWNRSPQKDLHTPGTGAPVWGLALTLSAPSPHQGLYSSEALPIAATRWQQSPPHRRLPLSARLTGPQIPEFHEHSSWELKEPLACAASSRRVRRRVAEPGLSPGGLHPSFLLSKPGLDSGAGMVQAGVWAGVQESPAQVWLW